jgi:drug/metabolite transporter (DMT)-like permease
MLGAVSAIWGASYLLIKIALDGLEPSMIVFARVTLAALLLYAVIVLRGGPDRVALSYLRAHPGRTVVQGALSVAIPFMLISFGETEISSGLTGVLISPGPLFVAMLAPFIDRSERVGRRAGLGVAIGFAGVVLLVGLDTVSSPGELVGALAVLGAAASYALGAMYAKLRFGGVPPLVVSLAACTTASLLTIAPAFATLPGSSPDAGELAAVAFLGVFGTAIAFVLYYSLIAEVGAGRASLCAYLIPPLALAYGAVLLDEPVTAAALGGLAMILAGVSLAGGEREVEGITGEQPAAAPAGAGGSAKL